MLLPLIATYLVALLPLSALSEPAASSPLSKRQTTQACNGYSELCSRSFDRVSFLTTHNSFAFEQGLIASNQRDSITTQLDKGIRSFMLDLHNPNSAINPTNLIPNNKRQAVAPTINLCHTSCFLLDAGPFVSQLQNFKTYVEAQPNNVITLILENYDNFSSADIFSSFTQADLAQYLFDPTTYTSNGVFTWPTLQTIISSKKNVIVFSSAITDQSTYPQLMRQGSYVAQTSFSVASGSPFDCAIAQTGLNLTIVNHFVYVNQNIGSTTFQVPSADASSTVNTLDSIKLQTDLCLAKNPPSFPNFVTLDFYDTGSGAEAVASINSVIFKDTSTKVFTASPPQGTSSSSTSRYQNAFVLILLPVLIANIF